MHSVIFKLCDPNQADLPQGATVCILLWENEDVKKSLSCQILIRTIFESKATVSPEEMRQQHICCDPVLLVTSIP